MEDVFLKQIAAAKALVAGTAPAPVPQAQVASLAAQLIGHALSHHVPSMHGGFVVVTHCGSWRVDGVLAKQMAELMRLHLMKQMETV